MLQFISIFLCSQSPPPLKKKDRQKEPEISYSQTLYEMNRSTYASFSKFPTTNIYEHAPINAIIATNTKA